MAQFDLAEVVDEITPFGCIMAGDWERDAPWRKKAAAKWAAKAEGRDPEADPRTFSGQRFGRKGRR